MRDLTGMPGTTGQYHRVDGELRHTRYVESGRYSRGEIGLESLGGTTAGWAQRPMRLRSASSRGWAQITCYYGYAEKYFMRKGVHHSQARGLSLFY